MAKIIIKDIHRKGLHARYAKPWGKCKAGVLLLPSAFGFGPGVDEQLAHLAQAGLAALAWNPYSAYDANLPREERSRISETVLMDADCLREQSSWIDYMMDNLSLPNVGLLGFCMGGRMAMLLAAEDSRIKAVSAFYPTMRDPRPANAIDLPPVADKIICPVQVHYPGKDHLTSYASLQRLRTALDARTSTQPAAILHYPQGTHGFLGKTKEASPQDFASGLTSWPVTTAFFNAALAIE
ncbi:MAG: dienelactone hydrolase family protein [Burkholderiales bacterium]